MSQIASFLKEGRGRGLGDKSFFLQTHITSLSCNHMVQQFDTHDFPGVPEFTGEKDIILAGLPIDLSRAFLERQALPRWMLVNKLIHVERNHNSLETVIPSLTMLFGP